MMRSNRPSAAATALKSHARALHARARQKTGARKERTNVRFASRCGDGRSSRPHRRVSFFKCNA
eukprot:7314071-Lingulodinium_polyedra.AAC.1